MIVFYIIFLILLFVGLLFVRAILFNPKPENEILLDEVKFDNEKAIKTLQELVKFKTISYKDKSLEDDLEFKNFTDSLPRFYPEVFKTCEFTELEDRALLFRWKGKVEGNPAVFMAHYDVVPVNEENWSKSPFSADIEDGFLWGRGTLDTKVTFNAILFAANQLILEGFVPENDIYFAFSGGEEVNGNGAVRIVDYFQSNNIEPAFVIDEGGAVVENVFPGVKEACALIGIGEKGIMDVEYKCKSAGGHASAPKPHTPVGILASACAKIENRPLKSHLTIPVAKMFDTLGRYSSFGYKLIFANLFCLAWVIDLICKKNGGELNALMRTTVAFTQMSGSKASNVIPPEATMVSNIRINPADNIDSVLSYLRDTVSDENVEISLIHGMNPSRVSTTDCDGWVKISDAVRATWKGCIVSPYLMVQCSDSRHYSKISDRVFRFSAMDLTSEERATIHGNDEKIRLDCISRSVEFYLRLIKKC